MTLPSVRAKIIELVPEIMELKFGCEVLIGGFTKPHSQVKIVEFLQSELLFDYIENGHHWRTDKNDIREILGSPIGIREVLLAIQNHGNKTVDSMELQLSYGTLHLKTKNGGFAKWNLEKDNLNEQSSETIELLATILWVKR